VSRVFVGGVIGTVAALIAQFMWLAPEASFWAQMPDIAALGVQVLWGGLVSAGLLYVGLRVASAPVQRHALVALGALVGGAVVTAMFVIAGLHGVRSDPVSVALSEVMVILRAAPALALAAWSLSRSPAGSWVMSW
jgi:hypothetical protein